MKKIIIVLCVLTILAHADNRNDLYEKNLSFNEASNTILTPLLLGSFDALAATYTPLILEKARDNIFLYITDLVKLDMNEKSLEECLALQQQVKHVWSKYSINIVVSAAIYVISYYSFIKSLKQNEMKRLEILYEKAGLEKEDGDVQLSLEGGLSKSLWKGTLLYFVSAVATKVTFNYFNARSRT